MMHDVRLGEEHHHTGDESREEQHDGSRQAQGDECRRGHGHQQQPRADDKGALQPFGKLRRLHAALLGMHQTCHKEYNQGDGKRRYRGDKHIPDMLEQRHLAHRRRQHRGVGEGRNLVRHLAHRRRQHRGVGEGRNLVTEIGTRNNGARRPPHAVAVRRADAHQGDANGGDGGPRTARHQRHQRADEASDEEEHRRRDHLHAVVYHRRHHAAQHPAARHSADEE